jgi:uncharacterized membrane protein YsdA (DUF1294 family)
LIDISFSISYFHAYLVVVSLVSFVIYAYDKFQALKKSQRVSEMKLLGSSLLGGSVGSILAMLIFRHKIKKASFIIKFSLVVIIQAVGFYLYLKGYTF